MSLLECNLSMNEDESKMNYSAPYKRMEFGSNEKDGGFFIEVTKYNNPENTRIETNGRTIFFFDDDEKETIMYWLKLLNRGLTNN